MAPHDAIIVGSGVAGAATALLLAAKGHRVVVVDYARRGRDTVSTHALMRPGVVQLERWGVLPAIVAAGTPPVSRVLFHYGEDVVTVDAERPLYAPRRTVLDTALIDAAERAGAEFRFGWKVDGLRHHPSGRVVGVEGRRPDGERFAITGRFTVGADGVRSRVAALTQPAVTRQGTSVTAVAYGYWSGVETDGYEWAFTPGTTAGLIPTNDGQVCVWISSSVDRFHSRWRHVLAGSVTHVLSTTFPDFARRVAAGSRVGRVRGYPGVAGYLRRPWGPGWALVGDAGSFKDPNTAHGMTDALIHAELLTDAIDDALAGHASSASAFDRYERLRDDLSTSIFETTEAIASLDWDFDRLRCHHLALSKAMQRETAFLSERTVRLAA